MASLVRRSFFSALVSGRYLLRSLKAEVAAVHCQPMTLIVTCMPLTVSVEDVLELSDGRGNLQPHVEDLLLALETDVGRPSHHTREVALGLDVLADTEVLGTLLEEHILLALEP